MSVKLRLKRMGRRHRPFYRIAVMDAKTPRGGKTVEIIGHYDPLVEDPARATALKKERAEYWLSVGAEPSLTVMSILRKHDVGMPIKAARKKRRKKKES